MADLGKNREEATTPMKNNGSQRFDGSQFHDSPTTSTPIHLEDVKTLLENSTHNQIILHPTQSQLSQVNGRSGLILDGGEGEKTVPVVPPSPASILRASPAAEHSEGNVSLGEGHYSGSLVESQGFITREQRKILSSWNATSTSGFFDDRNSTMTSSVLVHSNNTQDITTAVNSKDTTETYVPITATTSLNDTWQFSNSRTFEALKPEQWLSSDSVRSSKNGSNSLWNNTVITTESLFQNAPTSPSWSFLSPSSSNVTTMKNFTATLNFSSQATSAAGDDIQKHLAVTSDSAMDIYFVTSGEPPLDEVMTHDSEALWELVVKVVVLALISVCGSLGNVMVIWSVVRERHLHRPPFYFLLSLGVTDLSRAVFCVPVVITTVLHGSVWRHGDSACKLFAFATSFFVFSSALSLLAISIDRHVSIVYSKTYRRRAPGLANLVVAVVIWLVAFCVSFPPVVGLGEYVFIPGEAQCAFQHRHYSHNDSVASVLVFLAIMFLAYFLYFRIFKFLRAHRRMRPLQHQPAQSSSWAFVGPGANGQAFINWLNGFGGQAPIRQGGQRAVQRLNFGRVVNLSTAKNEHLTRLFLTLSLIFGAMWTPYVLLSLWRIFGDASVLPDAFVTVAAWLGYGQAAVCPPVYFLSKGPTRKTMRTVYSPAEKKEFLLENKIRK
ncbi:probable G-protein coupled receptor 173 [Aplysia californica]|uniref:Probable G-protein coupled receptor 173 n=1 Tax=Aplysia californica TaxID=6500 RepID=A0ABM0JEP5_APLCA|nr:probable G-protein coupled receptor 173 [Aplysia californica]XP_012946965.1 probable G-protein coupled receptor 173 [Aplysia californica]XP_035829856.1 probable G-protein coupled receptor 173 [Aplysia californica]